MVFNRAKVGNGPTHIQGFSPLLRLLLGLFLCCIPAEAESPADSGMVVRIAISTRTMGNANRSDVLAATRAWMATVARDKHLNIQPEAQFYDSAEGIIDALRKGGADVISVATDDFFRIEKVVPLVGAFSNVIQNRITEEYVIVVHRDRGVKDLRELRGGSIIILNEGRALLSPLWLDSELLHRKLPLTQGFFGKVTYAKNPALAILPVFFKQAGAAVVTRANLDTAAELNPQLRKQLVVLASSPPIVPMVGAYRANDSAKAIDIYRREGLTLGGFPAGRTLLTLFQVDDVVEIKDGDLSGTRSFLREHERLLQDAKRKGTLR